MKHFLSVLAFIVISVTAWSQTDMLSLNYGFEFANIEDVEEQGTGWRISADYEFNPEGGKLVHGVVLGYTSITATYTESNIDGEIKSKISSYPMYYAPKYFFGNGKVQAFIKGAAGVQLASIKREGAVTFSDTDGGLYLGGGGGLVLFVKDNIFINAEYEIAWVSNNYYRDGLLNSVMIGIGYKFNQN